MPSVLKYIIRLLINLFRYILLYNIIAILNMFKSNSAIFAVLVILLLSFPVSATSIDNILSSLNAMDNYSATLKYDVTLPLSDEEIIYDVSLKSNLAHGDTLNSCNYLIEYTSRKGNKGFMSYFANSYYRYENEKLREYHWAWDSIPFKQIGGGVQGSGMFVPLLPDVMAKSLMNIIGNSDNKVCFFSDTVVKQMNVNVITIEERKQGHTLRELLYAFDRITNRPVYVEMENNPGALSEQTVTVTYSTSSDTSKMEFNEQLLQDNYSEVFDKYRVCNFKIENMPGRRLPGFSLPTTTGERYSWDGGFKSPTIVAFLDSRGGMTASTIADVRQAVASLPMVADVIWIFMGNNLEDIWQVMPTTEINESALIGGRKFASECGVTGCPTLLFVDKERIVKDVLLGYNNDMKNIVIQKMALLNSK